MFWHNRTHLYARTRTSVWDIVVTVVRAEHRVWVFLVMSENSKDYCGVHFIWQEQNQQGGKVWGKVLIRKDRDKGMAQYVTNQCLSCL